MSHAHAPGLISENPAPAFATTHNAYLAHGQAVPVLRAKTMAMAEAAPMPVEAGESEVSVHVTGQIELLE